MDFLNKLYESNFFGIGLFAVISFLVVTFLIVLFFGKKDEKKRKMEEQSNSGISNNTNAFQETTPVAPLEIPTTPVAPINFDAPVDQKIEPVTPVAPVPPITPINLGETEATVAPVAPIVEPIMPQVENVTPVVSSNPLNKEPEKEIINEPVKPIIPESPVTPVIVENPTPIEVAPVVMEPIKITIPDEEPKVEKTVVTPIIEEQVTPIVTPVYNEPIKVIEEPVINNTYYEPETPKKEEVSVSSIDFDAIAESISKELDELERNTKASRNYGEVKITPINEVTNDVPPVKAPTTFSSVYVNEPVKEPTPVVTPTTIDMPTKIELPTRKED